MPAQVFGAQATAVELYIAFYGAAPSNPIYNNLLAVEGASSPQALALTIGNQFATTSDADLAKMVLTNLGISAATTNQTAYDALLAGLTAAFGAYPTARGIVVLNLANILTTLETNATYGGAAQTFNQSVTNAYVYASNTNNTQTQTLGGITTTQPLTVNAGDLVNGTSGSDNINGNLFFNAPSGTYLQTLQSGDTVVGGSGTDTLNVGIGGVNTSVGTSILPTLTSIENLNVNALATAAGGAGYATVDLVNSTGLATVSLSNAPAAAGAGGASGGQFTTGGLVLLRAGTVLNTISLNNTAASVVVSSNASTVAGTADAITVNLNQAGSATSVSVGATAAPVVTLPGYETITINSTGAAMNAIQLSATGSSGAVSGYSPGATVKVTGDTSVSVDTGNSNGTLTIDASGMTGSAALRLVSDITNFVGATAGNSAIKATGTANGDYFVLNGNYGLGTTLVDTIDGGAGTDTLQLTTAQATSTSNQTTLSNLEVLAVSDTYAAGTVLRPANYGGATAVTLMASNAVGNDITINYGAGTAGLNLNNNNTGPITANSTGSATTDVLNVTVGTASSGSITEGGLIKTVGFETVNVTSSGALGSTNTLGFIQMAASAATETLNISGARDVRLFNGQFDVLNASTLTGNLVMGSQAAGAKGDATFSSNAASTTGGLFGVQITGGSGNDVLVGSNGSDVIVGGAGNDTILFGTNSSAAVNFSYNQGDIVTGGDGKDEFRFIGVSQNDLLRQSALSDPDGAGAGTPAQQIVKITDFTAGTDKIGLVGGGFTSATVATATVATADTLAAVYAGGNGAAASTATNASVVVITVSAGLMAGTYLFVNDQATGGAGSIADTANDMLINITGVSGAVTAADFSFT